jgi:hypothetical protein
MKKLTRNKICKYLDEHVDKENCIDGLYAAIKWAQLELEKRNPEKVCELKDARDVLKISSVLKEFIEYFKEEYRPFGDCETGCYESTLEELDSRLEEFIMRYAVRATGNKP